MSCACLDKLFACEPNWGDKITRSLEANADSCWPQANAAALIFLILLAFNPLLIVFASTADEPAPKHNTNTWYFLLGSIPLVDAWVGFSVLTGAAVVAATTEGATSFSTFAQGFLHWAISALFLEIISLNDCFLFAF